MSKFSHLGDWDDLFRESAHELMDLTGKPVRLATRVQTGFDEDYGDPIVENHTTETTAEVVVRGTPSFSRRFEGVDLDVTAVAWIKDTVSIPIDDTQSASDFATRLYVLTNESDGGHAFAVHNQFDERNGRVRLHLVSHNDWDERNA